MSSVENCNENLENRDPEVVISSLEAIEESKAETTSEDVKPEASADEAPREYPYNNNDAVILGPIDEHVASIPLRLGGGTDRKCKRWPVKAKYETYGALIDEMSRHVVGSKDGLAWMQGNAIGNERKVPAIKELCVMGLDVDSGAFPDAVINKLAERGLTAIIYTTHSHMKGDTFLLESSYNQFCKKARIEATTNQYDLTTVKRYFIEEKHWESWLVETLRVGDPDQTEEGKGVWLHHDPMPKFRVVLPLNEPFVIAKQAMTQLDAVKLWKRKLVGLAKWLELPIDEACLDPSRLFYLPRHKDGAPFGVWVTGGEGLDFDSIPVGAIKGDRQQADAFMQHGEQLAGKDGPDFVVGNNFSLKKWAAQKAKGFDIATMFRVAAPEKIRNDQNTTKVTIKCPFDHYHSNPEDPEDTGCYVESAAPEMSKSFTFACSHNSCKGRDRLEFVAEAVNQGWITTDDLESEDYQAFLIEETKDEKLDKLMKRVEATVTVDTGDSDLDSIFRDLAELAPSPKQWESIVDRINDKREVTQHAGRKKLRTYFTKNFLEKANEKRIKQKTKEKAKEGTRSDVDGKPALYPASDGVNVCIEKAFERLLELNAKGHLYYEMGRQKVVVDTAPNGKVTTIPIGDDQMASELRRACDWYSLRGEEAVSISPPHDIVSDILTYRGHRFPRLERMSRVPFFTPSGELICEKGYNEETGVYYAPTPGFVLPSITDDPSDEDIRKAIALVNENLFEGFPFDDQDGTTGGTSSRAHAWCLLLERFIREMIDGFCPIHFVVKPEAGTGASLFIDAITAIPLGEPAAPQVEKKDIEEQRKNFTSFLTTGGEFFRLDNLNFRLAGSVLALAATSREWEDRLLSTNTLARFLIRNGFIAAGNNTQVSDEISRRCLPIRLDAKRNPKKGRKFKHKNLMAWVMANRADLVAAVLTVVKAWIAKGKPAWSGGQALASYEPYCAVMGGILEAVNIPGFLGNLHITQVVANGENAAKREFLSTWWRARGEKPGPIGDPDGLRIGIDGKDSLVSYIRDNSIDIDLKGVDGHEMARNLGYWLKKHLDSTCEIEGGIEVRLERIEASKTDTNSNHWYLKRIDVYAVDWAKEVAYLDSIVIGRLLEAAAFLDDETD